MMMPEVRPSLQPLPSSCSEYLPAGGPPQPPTPRGTTERWDSIPLLSTTARQQQPQPLPLGGVPRFPKPPVGGEGATTTTTTGPHRACIERVRLWVWKRLWLPTRLATPAGSDVRLPEPARAGDATLPDVAPDGRKLVCGRFYADVLALLLRYALMYLGFLYVYAAVFGSSNLTSSELFQPSAPVNSTSVYNSLHNEVRPGLVRFLLTHPDEWAVGAPNLHIYMRYMVMRYDQGTIVEVLNPRYTVPANTAYVTLREHSLMCHVDLDHDDKKAEDKHMHSKMASRAKEIDLTYEIVPGFTHQMRLKGRDAYAVQHYVDIFEGRWLCPVSTRNATQMAIPRLLHQDDL